MRNNKLNRNFKRLLAVSLGACCASTMMVCAMEQNDNQNEKQPDVQTILLSINQQGRKNIWDTITTENNATAKYNANQGWILDFSLDGRGDQDHVMLDFLLLTCKDNGQDNAVKLMMLKDNGDAIYILPYNEQCEKIQHAKNITQYIKNNPNMNIAQFEKDCWNNKTNIYQHITTLIKPQGQVHIQPPREYDVGIIQRAKKWWGGLSVQNQVNLTIAACPLAGIVLNGVFRK